VSRRSLAAAVRARRHDLRLPQYLVHYRGGPPPATLRKIERGNPVYGTTLGRLDRALGWSAGTALALLRDQPPPPPDPPPPPPPPPPGEGDTTVAMMLATAMRTDELYALAHHVLDELARRHRVHPDDPAPDDPAPDDEETGR
jgi:hypothetical protein